jgi:hypothetical protein
MNIDNLLGPDAPETQRVMREAMEEQSRELTKRMSIDRAAVKAAILAKCGQHRCIGWDRLARHLQKTFPTLQSFDVKEIVWEMLADDHTLDLTADRNLTIRKN